ncbi:protein LURP-one-related 10-like [Castanea sativa]|uniref:protein LURP-one-related 10-like n=1 Tax=Castanea sativa TaxID=21020 RepID=UPI003F65169A
MTAHRRWKAYRGDSTDSKDLLFGAKTKLDVFLAHNTKERFVNSRLKEMRKKQTAESILIRKDYFMVTVYPDIDYAFIVALIVILDEINHPKHVDSGAG